MRYMPHPQVASWSKCSPFQKLKRPFWFTATVPNTQPYGRILRPLCVQVGLGQLIGAELSGVCQSGAECRGLLPEAPESMLYDSPLPTTDKGSWQAALDGRIRHQQCLRVNGTHHITEVVLLSNTVCCPCACSVLWVVAVRMTTTAVHMTNIGQT